MVRTSIIKTMKEKVFYIGQQPKVDRIFPFEIHYDMNRNLMFLASDVVADLLINGGATNVSVLDNIGKTPLFYAALAGNRLIMNLQDLNCIMLMRIHIF